MLLAHCGRADRGCAARAARGSKPPGTTRIVPEVATRRGSAGTLTTCAMRRMSRASLWLNRVTSATARASGARAR
jgi:hypothetical protein